MNVRRYYNVLNSAYFGQVDQILNHRFWTMQTSDQNTKNVFFFSPLNDEEIQFFANHTANLFREYLAENSIPVSEATFERAYINCHPCYHPGDWHVDNSSGVTMLYYPNSPVDFGQEGGTEIDTHGYEPYVSNSLLIFPAHLLHFARQHTVHGAFRFSIAFKFQTNPALA